MGKLKLTSRQVSHVKRLRTQGWSYRKLAEKFNIGHHLTIRRYLDPAFREKTARKAREHARQGNWRRNRYGVTKDWYNGECEKRDNKCDICRRKVNALGVDHCHVSGEIRGLLCHKCNSGIGLLGDGLNGICDALSYLIKAEKRATDKFQDDELV